MENKQKINKLGLICLAVIILLFGIVAFSLIKQPTITGFVVANISNETQLNETTETIETTTTDETNLTEDISVINETSEEKGKPEKVEKEKPEPNTPPVWKSDVNEFIIDGTTIIDLNNYFFDKNNDTIGYAATSPENIAVEIDGSLATITPAGHNFNSTITIAASDGDKSTTKEISLIIPERKITIDLEYKTDSIYDIDNDGVETTYGIIDLTVENTNFNWDVDESNLCTRWETYSVEDEESTIVCYGSSKCCNFVGLMSTKPLWNEPFYSSYGTYGAGFNNIVSSQVLYVDYEIAVEDPFADIYYSDWSDLSASYYSAFTDFEDVCVDTCTLTGFNDTSYTLIFEIEDAVLELDSLSYTLIETIDQVSVALDVEDSEGLTSGTYSLYKDDILVSVVDNLVEPDYYDIEVIPEEDVIEKLLIYNTNIIEPLTASIGIDNVSRQQEIKDVEIKKQYAIDPSELEFTSATLTATATANSLFKCKQWDYETEVCYGTWEKIKDLIAGEEYELTITADDPGFVEGNLNITITPVNITPINVTEIALIKNISDINIAINNNYTINLNEYFSNLDSNVVFTYNSIGNMSIVFDNNIATIVPDKDYIGAAFTFITATRDYDSVSSNIFKITVANVTITELNITPKITPKKKHFKFDEDIDLDFEYLTETELTKQGRSLEKSVKPKQKKKWVQDKETIETSVYDSNNNLVDIDVEIEELREGKFNIKLPKQRAFRAGKYTIKLELIKDGITYTQEQDFTWGVLAINVNKSIYLENEDSFIGIAVLDDQGSMVCDADVTLEITDPLAQKTTLTTAAGDIKISPECEVYGVTNLPDYYTDYTVSGVGTYVMNLTAETFNGIRSIQDNFSVQSSVDFDVARDGPTRIYPLANYTMNFTINANKNYNGLINEYVPASFDITPQDGLTVIEFGDPKILTWSVDLKKGETINLYYEFDAPDVSPEFYLLGALQIGSWQEFRNWQIASDPGSITDELFQPCPSTSNCDPGSQEIDVEMNVRITYTLTGQNDNIGFSANLEFGAGGGAGTDGAGTDILNAVGDCSGDTDGWYFTSTEQTATCDGPSVTTCAFNDATNLMEWDDPTGVVGETMIANWYIAPCTLADGSGNDPADIGTTCQKDGGSANAACDTYVDEIEIDPAADTTPPGVNITNINKTNGQNTRINDVLNISCQSFNDPSVGNITFNLTGGVAGAGDFDWYNFSFEGLPETADANFSQNITMNVTRGNVINATCWVADSTGNTAQNSTTITIVNRAPPTPVIKNTTNQFFNRNQTFNITPLIDEDVDTLTYSWFYNLTGGIYVPIQSSTTATAWTTNVTDGTYGILINVTDGTDITSSGYWNFTIDSIVPVVNASLNESLTNIGLGDVINITANATDETGLSFGQIIVNASPAGSELIRYFNFSFSGKEDDGNFSQNITIDCNGGCVINFTARVNDTAGNWRMNDTIVTLIDKINPVVNTTLNKSLTSIFQNDVINITANITDNIELSFCQVIINQTGMEDIHIINISLSGTTDKCSNKSDINVAAGNVINFTIRANDTSNNWRTNDTIITVESAATAPVITLNNVTTFTVDPVAGEDVEVLISFNVTDEQGVGNINASKAVVNFTLGYDDGQWRSNVSDGSDSEFGTCYNHTEDDTTVIINCTVRMKYYDNASTWAINVSVVDTDGKVGRNDTQSFIYNELSSIDLPYESSQFASGTTNFSSVYLGQQDVRSYPHLVINHTGNDDFNMINITGSGLIGTTDSSKSVAITSFGVNLTNMSAVDGDVNKRLTFPSGGTAQLTDPDCVDSDPTNCNATLQHGHSSAKTDYNDVVISAKGNVSVFFWVDVPSSGLTPQLYNNTWNITVSTDNT